MTVNIMQGPFLWSALDRLPLYKHNNVFISLGKVSKKYIKKWLDLSNAHLTPASQAERWITKFKNSTIFVCLYFLYNHQNWREL